MSRYDNEDPPPAYQAEDPNPLAVSSSTSQVAAQRARSASYHIYRSTFGGYVVSLEDIEAILCVETRTIRTPDLLVRNKVPGSDVAHCIIVESSDSYDVRVFREPGVKQSIQHTKMTPDRRFTCAVPLLDENGAACPNTSVQRSFLWTTSPSLKLVDNTGLVIAVVHTPTSTAEKCAIVELYVSYDNSFNVLVLTTFLAIYEKTRRTYGASFGIMFPSQFTNILTRSVLWSGGSDGRRRM